MGKSIRTTFGMNPVNTLDAAAFYKSNLPEVIDSNQLIGIEVEVENHTLSRQPNPVWVMKGDGSLRNQGVEWITHPIQARWAPHALEDLLGRSLSTDCCFSPRTSIHVHFDMQEKDTNTAVDVTLLYLLFEPLFYKFTGRGRIKNIYCVPLMDTNLITRMNHESIAAISEGWSKYTGLNLIPLRELGTIEARHMHGTFDYKKVVTWIRIWCKLIDYAEKQGSAVIRRMLMELNPFSDYQQLLGNIFGDDQMSLKYDSFRDIERSLDVVKRAFIDGKQMNGLLKQVSSKSTYLGGN